MLPIKLQQNCIAIMQSIQGSGQGTQLNKGGLKARVGIKSITREMKILAGMGLVMSKKTLTVPSDEGIAMLINELQSTQVRTGRKPRADKGTKKVQMTGIKEFPLESGKTLVWNIDEDSYGLREGTVSILPCEYKFAQLVDVKSRLTIDNMALLEQATAE